MINLNLELRPQLRRPRRRQPLTQAQIDATRIDRRRYFAHRTQIATSLIWNTHWERYEFPRQRINPWWCLAVMAGCLFGLWRLLA